jgi:ADP-heptose:LPS heptosyltransferase
MTSLSHRIEVLWRQHVVYPSLRLLLRNDSIQLPLDAPRVRSILILRNDRLGDMIATTPVFRLLKARYPRIRLGVAASEDNAVVIRQNPHIDDIYTVRRGSVHAFAGIHGVRRRRYDVVLNFIFNRMTESGLIANMAAPGAIKIGAGEERYRPLFNALVPLERYQKHMALVLLDYVERVFGIHRGKGDEELELFIPDSAKSRVTSFLSQNGLPPRDSEDRGPGFLVINGSAPDQRRRLSDSQLERLLRHVAKFNTLQTVVIAAPADLPKVRRIVSRVISPSLRVFPEAGSASIMETAALIGAAACVVTPDTSIVHFASATKTPVLALYSTTSPVKEWLPYRVRNRILMADEGLPVSSLPAEQLIVALNAFLAELAHPSKDS